jgi:hypothetical protein
MFILLYLTLSLATPDAAVGPSDPVSMFLAFTDGSSYDEQVERKVCEEMNEASGDPDKILFAFWPPTGQLKQVVMVICRGKDDLE